MPNEMNILLVEDNDLDAMILERTLKRMDLPATVVRARDGIEALEILEGEKLDPSLNGPFFILLDINMPRMNGHDFLRTLRSKEAIADQLVFMFTTSDSPHDVSLAYKWNVSGYFVKPQGSAELKRVLTSLHNFWKDCIPPAAARYS
ncbi:response regulator [Phycobacter sp. K97]|uniref:response regulator n=1 Tax=Phycobacter sedimenti TaxID=3133977 RepID=UPI00311E5491